MATAFASQLVGQFGSTFDFASYTIKDWLQLAVAASGIVGAVIGAWNWWRFSKWQIVNRLFEYLNTDEKNIVEGRRAVLGYLRTGRRSSLDPTLEFHERIQKAIQLLDSSRQIEAEALLARFALNLKGSAEVGRRHTAVAGEQAATIFLFIALLAKQRADVVAARSALTEAQEQREEADPEIIRTLGELDIDVDLPSARSRFQEAIRLAPGDSLLQGELWALTAKAYEREHTPALKDHRKALLEAAACFATAGADRQAAEAYDQAGALEIRLGFRRRAIGSSNDALRLYQRLNDARGTKNMRERLKALGAAPQAPQISTMAGSNWASLPTLRIAAELAILATATVLFYLSLR
jgi:tetratricopeptide (TPR) repeat protein